MTLAGSKVIELEVPDIQEWASNRCSYTLAEIDFGQVRATIYKSTDRVIHVYLLAGEFAVREEIPLNSKEVTPLRLEVHWNEERVALKLAERQKTQHPWCKLPLPLRQ